MELWVWLNFTLLFLAGGLTPGPAVILVTTASIRYGFWASMAPAVGICAANLVWITLASSGVAVVAKTFPEAFLAFKLLGIAFIVWLAWRTAFGGLLPTYFNPDHDMIPQVIISMATVTVCEMFGLVVYATGADALARRFQSPAFATGFFRIAALAMVMSAAFAVYLTWSTTGR